MCQYKILGVIGFVSPWYKTNSKNLIILKNGRFDVSISFMMAEYFCLQNKEFLHPQSEFFNMCYLFSHLETLSRTYYDIY